MSTSQENLYSVYLPVDRLQALARNIELPEHDQGAALFADISGFTRLTDALQRALGRGAAPKRWRAILTWSMTP